MILDRLENIGNYRGLGRGLDIALAFLANEGMEMDEARVYDLGYGVSARCAVYVPVAPAEGTAEAHRKFIDVMLVKEGGEQIGYKNVRALKHITREYDEASDALLAKDEMTLIPFNKGDFAIWFPQDAHMPGVCEKNAQTVKRVIVKVPAE